MCLLPPYGNNESNRNRSIDNFVHCNIPISDVCKSSHVRCNTFFEPLQAPSQRLSNTCSAVQLSRPVVTAVQAAGEVRTPPPALSLCLGPSIACTKKTLISLISTFFSITRTLFLHQQRALLPGAPTGRFLSSTCRRR